MIGLVLVGFVLFGAASLALYQINDRIVSDVCRRENRPYTPCWSLLPYWQWRTSVTGWSDARLAGLLLPKALASAAVALLVIGFVMAGVVANAPG